MKQSPLLVTGATGDQGGSVARALLSQGHQVHALVRDPSSPKGQKLQQSGAQLFPGDFDDVASIEKAAVGCSGVFMVFASSIRPDGEFQQAQNILTACKNAQTVRKVVFSGVARAGEHESFASFHPSDWIMAGYWLNKARIQSYVQSSTSAEMGFDAYTVLQPPLLMKNLVAPVVHGYFPELRTRHVLRGAFRPDTIIPILDPKQLGETAAKALTTAELDNQTLPLAGDTLTLAQIAERIARASGRDDVRVEYIDGQEAQRQRKTNRMIASHFWFNESGPQIDLDEVRSLGVHLSTLDEFLAREKDALEKAFEP